MLLAGTLDFFLKFTGLDSIGNSYSIQPGHIKSYLTLGFIGGRVKKKKKEEEEEEERRRKKKKKSKSKSRMHSLYNPTVLYRLSTFKYQALIITRTTRL